MESKKSVTKIDKYQILFIILVIIFVCIMIVVLIISERRALKKGMAGE